MKDTTIIPSSSQSDSKETEPTQRDAKRIEINGTFSMGRSDIEPEVLLPRTKSNSIVEKLAAAVRDGLMDLLNSPPDVNELQRLVDSMQSDAEALDKISLLFSSRRYNANKEHIELLTTVESALLPYEKRLILHDTLCSIYRYRKEYSLALEQIDTCLSLSQSGEALALLRRMTTRGWCLARLEHPHTEVYHREIVAFASRHGLQEYLESAYRTWSSFLWNKGNYLESLFLLERSVKLRQHEGPERYLRAIYSLALKYETVDKKKAVAKCLDAAMILESNSRDLPDLLRAEAHYETACILFRNTEDHQCIVKHALVAYALFDQWIGYEIRTAWCAKLLANSYQELGESAKSASFQEDYQGRLKLGGKEKETFALLAEPILKGSAQPADLQHLEALVREANDQQLTLRWSILFSLDCNKNNQNEEGLSMCNYALSSIDENEYRALYGAADLAHLYRAMAECQLAMRMMQEYIYSMRMAICYLPADHHSRWILCHNAFIVGDLQVALEQALWLQKHAPCIGAYRVHARVLLANGDLEGSLSVISVAQAQYPGHPHIADEFRELSEIKLGLLTPAQSTFFKPSASTLSTISIGSSDVPDKIALPEFSRLDDFKKSIVNTIVTYIHDIEKTIPGFISKYKRHPTNLEEGDFRDDIERICGQKWREIGAETRHGNGRTDLIIRQPAPSLDAIIVEFKVWGRNDYRDVTSQLIDYLTDFQATGVVFMINANKAPISKKYLSNIILAHPSYVVGSFRDKPLLQGRLDHFYSRHLSLMNKEISIFHFVLNIWEGAPNS